MKQNESWLSRHITLHNHASVQDEKENFVSHLIGAIASILFLLAVLVRRDIFVSPSTWIGMIVYGITLTLLYCSSSLYHITPKGDLKRIFRVLDHTNIYFLIAGTYTPILLYIGSSVAVRITVIVWTIAAVGIVFTLLFWGKFRLLHILFYLGMGWFIVFFWDDIVPYIPGGLLRWIIGAGITYTTGVIFYANKRLNHNHMIWHIFCVIASALFCIGFLIHLTG